MKDISEEADERDPDTSLSEDLRIFRIQGSGFVNGLRIPTTQHRIITSPDSGDRIHPSQRVSNASLRLGDQKIQNQKEIANRETERNGSAAIVG